MSDEKQVDPRTDIKHLLLENKIDHMTSDIKEIKDALKGTYVTQDQFAPVKTIVYGLVGIILVSVVGALLTLIINK